MMCKMCGCRMKQVISFSKEKAETFKRCPNCWFQGKGKPYSFPDAEIMQIKYNHNSIAPPNGKGANHVQRIHNNNQRTKKA